MTINEHDEETEGAWTTIATFMAGVGIPDLDELLATGAFVTEVDDADQEQYARAAAMHLYGDVSGPGLVVRGMNPKAALAEICVTLIGRVVASDHELTVDDEGRAWIPDLCDSGLMEVTEERLTIWWWNLLLIDSDERCEKLLASVPAVVRDEAVERAGRTWEPRDLELFGLS